MKSLLILALTGLLALLPLQSSASWYNPTPQELVKWAGCNAQVITSDEHSAAESFYNRGRIYFGTAPDVPKPMARMILLHEIGHCLQDQALNGNIDEYYPLDRVTFELDADRISAELACSRGEEGVRLQRELLDWVHDTYNYNGDAGHGSLDQRKAAGASAQACHKDIQS